MDDDDFDFSDADLDDLPANALQQLETTAIRATQQPRDTRDLTPVEDSAYYGFDEGNEDEVVNLDDTRGPPHFANDIVNGGYAGSHGGYQTTQQENGGGVQYDGAMEVDRVPQQSQVDVGKLLERINKVGTNVGNTFGMWLTAAVRARKTAAEFEFGDRLS